MARLKLFAAIRESAGRSEDDIDAADLGGFLDEARRRYGPEFSAQLEAATVVVNGERVAPAAFGSTVLSPADEVALLPPVSGGEAAGAPRPVLAGPSALPGVIAGVFGLMALAMSAVGSGAFAVFLAGALVFAVVELGRMMARGGLGLPVPAAAASAAVFVVAALRWGEGSFLIAAGASVIGGAAFYVARGLRPGVTQGFGLYVFAGMYTGFLGSYAVLIRRSGAGERLIVALALMIAFYYVGRWLGHSQMRRADGGAGEGLRSMLAPAGAGVAGCIVASLVAGYTLGLSASPGATVALGVIVGVACAIGNMMGALMRSSLGIGPRRATLPGSGGILMQLETVLLAAPAFFYGFRLYLT